MEVIKVIVDRFPNNCTCCHLMSVIWPHCCQAILDDNEQFAKIEDISTRPDWCPLTTLAENESIGIFRHIGKGKIIPDTEMWIDEEKE